MGPRNLFIVVLVACQLLGGLSRCHCCSTLYSIGQVVILPIKKMVFFHTNRLQMRPTNKAVRIDLLSFGHNSPFWARRCAPHASSEYSGTPIHWVDRKHPLPQFQSSAQVTSNLTSCGSDNLSLLGSLTWRPPSSFDSRSINQFRYQSTNPWPRPSLYYFPLRQGKKT